MKLLFIIPYVPYPLDSGGSQAFFSMIDSLRGGNNEIHLILPVFRHNVDDFNALKAIWSEIVFHPYYFNDEKPSEFLDISVSAEEKQEYNSVFFNLISYMSASSRRKIARYRRKHPLFHDDSSTLVREKSILFSKNPFLTEGFLKHVQEISRQGFDCIQVEFYDFLPLYRFLPENTVRIFVHHEIRFVRISNELDLFNSATLEEQLLAERQRQEETGMLNEYDHIIVLTNTDKDILSRYISPDRIKVSPAIIKKDEKKQADHFTACGTEFVFIGSNGHFPNYDGINWLCHDIIPILRRLIPEFRIHIIGKWDSRISKLLRSKFPELSFEGFVSDISQSLRGKISIVPIRIGSGMRMKILESVKCMSPFITTGKGVEGQDFRNGKDCLIADTADEFAKAMARLSEDIALQKSLAENAVSRLHSEYDADKMLRIRKEIYSDIIKPSTGSGKPANMQTSDCMS